MKKSSTSSDERGANKKMMTRPSLPVQKSKKPKLLMRFNSLMLVLWVCIVICILLSIHIHSQLHDHDHHNQHAALANNDRRGSIRITLSRQSDGTNGDSIVHDGATFTLNHSHLPNTDSDHAIHSKNSIHSNINSNNNKQSFFSACLLINDENPRLPEWIAYHYHTLPLRHLIVAIDPSSRSSPLPILERWETMTEMEFKIWNDVDFLPSVDKFGKDVRRGDKCDGNDGETDCLWHHRKRQRYFVKKCMADFKKRNKTWTLLTDVDEYVTFNHIKENDDPPLPLAMAPKGVPTLCDWKAKEYHSVDNVTGLVDMGVEVEGTITGLPNDVGHHNGAGNGDHISTGTLVTANYDYFQGTDGVAYGNVVTNRKGERYFLRDDFAFRDAVPMAQAPGAVPTLRDSHVNGTTLYAAIYNDYQGGNADGTRIEIETNWREPPTEWADGSRTLLGGHLMIATDRRTFYVERERSLWPPHLSPAELMSVRRRLPRPPTTTRGSDEKSSNKAYSTILDVLESETRIFGDYAKETIGPCLSMPRLLYGSYENRTDDVAAASLVWTDGNDRAATPDGFDELDFVTLRYRWHAVKEARANKFQKAMVDVSRLRMEAFDGEAENIHVPLRYYCRKDPPRYSTSYFRVNHYLDSFEAYSYRNDARSNKRQCRECYDQKGREATTSMDDDIRPWLKSFVESVGHEKAKKLLAGAGKFVRLS